MSARHELLRVAYPDRQGHALDHVRALTARSIAIETRRTVQLGERLAVALVLPGCFESPPLVGTVASTDPVELELDDRGRRELARIDDLVGAHERWWARPGYARLAALPRLRLASLPTPLHRAERVGVGELWLKRDDLTGFGFGGNKIRKLELIAADALRFGADTIVTGAGVQSNWVRAAMAVAAHVGLQGIAVFHGQSPGERRGNFLLDELVGAELCVTGNPDRAALDAAIAARAERARDAGRMPYVIGRGGATPLGVASYVLAMLELAVQADALGAAFDEVVLATGSCGTQAGLVLGAKWLGLDLRVRGITVSRGADECRARIGKLARDAAALLGLELAITDDDIVVDDRYIGEGYGIPTPAGAAAIRRMARTEGAFLDPVYTGKAFAGLLDGIERGTIARTARLCFLHSGGSPALFA
ncbi:MAG TPA: pyridoxal-phosphate dependent enzyme [Kofleriaceae bacterium]|nr:pyridoxal-phosphate dependent enzyme [Kofleriaceae bacterium]